MEHQTLKKLIAWCKLNKLYDTQKYHHYGIHYTDPQTIPEHLHRVDFAITYDCFIEANCYGIINKTIPELRCAKATDIGSRYNNQAIKYLIQQWLPLSGEQLGNYPPIYHYVNVGPNIPPEEMITDVYLPLK